MSTVLQFPQHSINEPQQEACKPKQVATMEDGYTRIPNALLEALTLHDLTKRHLKIALAVARATLGFDKGMDWVSGSQLEAKTGIAENKAREAVRELVSLCVLIKDGRKIGINMCVSDWRTEQPQNGVNDPKMGLKNNPKMGLETTPKWGHTKETLQNKTDKTSNASALVAHAPEPVIVDQPTEPKPAPKKPAAKKSELDYSGWPALPCTQILTDWLELRKKLRAPVTQTVISRISNELHKAAQAGYTVDDCLGLACERGWRGIKAEWVINANNQNTGANHAISRPNTQQQRAEVDAAINNWQDTSWAADLIRGDDPGYI